MARRGTAETEVKTIISGKDKSQKAFRSLQTSLKNTSRTLQVVQGPLGPIAGRFTALSSAMGSVSLKAVGFSAAIVGATVAMGKGSKVFAQTQKQLNQLQAQLTATGYAAGKSSYELETLAQDVARSTLASLTEVRTAQGILLSFRSISEESFDGALRAAQDLAAAGFGSITDAAKQLGKALEDPATGLSSLRRAGVTFSASQQTVIKDLVETGDKAKAMELILAGISAQVGGAGEGAGAGLAGSFDSLSQSIENFWSALGSKVERAGFLSFIDDAAEGVQKFADSMMSVDTAGMGELTRRLQENFAELTAAQKELDRRRDLRDDPSAIIKPPVQAQESRVRELQEERDLLVSQFKVRKDAADFADGERAKTQEKLAEEERIAAAKKRQLELDKEIAAWQRNAEKDLQKLVVQEQKREAALRGVLANLDPVGEINRKFAEDQRILNESIENQVELKKLLLILDEQRLEAIDAILNKEQELTDSQKKVKEGADAIARTMGDGFKAATLEGKKFGDVMGDMLKRIAEQLVEILVVQQLVQGISSGIQSSFGGAGGAGGTGGAPIVDRGVPVGTGAIGGMRSGATLIGEKGPEVLNLPPGSKITPNHKLGGDTNIVVNNNGSNEVEVEEKPDGTVLINIIEQTVNRSIASNGSIGRTMQHAFGTQRQVVAR